MIAGEDHFLQRIVAQGRADRLLVHELDRRGKRAGVETFNECLARVHREFSGDDRACRR